jgi:hypothetical protein
MLAIGKDIGNTARKVKGKVKACRIEYETKDRTNWKAVIMAYSIEDAIAYIRSHVPGFDRYISTSVLAEVDGIEDTVFDDFFVKKVSVVETVTSKDDSDKDTEGSLTCPWCEKKFLNKITLGSHIKRFHMDNK